jgi:DNA-binding transcriptional ArsR family regulator
VKLDYRLSVNFTPLHEFISSLHTYICSKSYKKIDLAFTWVKDTERRLSPELTRLLELTEVNGDWRHMYLLAMICPGGAECPEDAIQWIEGHSVGDLYELLAGYGNQFPEDMDAFRSHALRLFTAWNEEYFQYVDPEILNALRLEAGRRQTALPTMTPAEFIDDTTNGLMFKPINGLEEIILIPQYHFQPLNVIWHFKKLTMCHYASRQYPNETDEFSPHHYRMIRSLGEMSRLKILRFLHQGPHSFIEIVRHLKLSKGITHDHLFKLRSAGFIHAHFEGEVLTEYSLRPKALHEMNDILFRYVEGR